MKKICVIIIGLSLVLLNCSQERNSKDKPELIVPNRSVITDTLFKTLNDYTKYLGHNQYIVYQIFINQNPDSLLFYLTFIQFKKELEYYQPSGYIKMDSSLFLVYSGIEKLLNRIPEFDSKVNDELSKIKLNEKGDAPFILEQVPWCIVYSFKDNSYKVNKRTNCPYGWPKRL